MDQDEIPAAWVHGIVFDTRETPPAADMALSKSAAFVVAFDDHGAPLDSADVVISPWGRTATRSHAGTILTGLRYALVGDEFSRITPASIRKQPHHVFIAFGYRDSVNASGRVLQSLKRLETRGWSPDITVVLGGGAPHRRAVQALTTAFGDRGQFLEDVNDMTALLSACDLAIGAGGTAALERAAAGRPSISIALNQGQRGLITTLSTAKATVDGGRIDSLCDRDLDEMIWGLAQDASLRKALAQQSRASVDGRGAERIAATLGALQ